MVVNPARAVFGVECRQCNVGEETSLEVQMVLQNIKDLLLFFIKKISFTIMLQSFLYDFSHQYPPW